MILTLATEYGRYQIERPNDESFREFSWRFFESGRLIPLSDKLYINPAQVYTVLIEEEE